MDAIWVPKAGTTSCGETRRPRGSEGVPPPLPQAGMMPNRREYFVSLSVMERSLEHLEDDAQGGPLASNRPKSRRSYLACRSCSGARSRLRVNQGPALTEHLLLTPRGLQSEAKGHIFDGWDEHSRAITRSLEFSASCPIRGGRSDEVHPGAG